jgi:hypothetical protein
MVVHRETLNIASGALWYTGVAPIAGHVYLLKFGVFWDVMRVAIVRTDVSEELSTSIIRMTRIVELGTKLVCVGC